jgi:hypothetical protein
MHLGFPSVFFSLSLFSLSFFLSLLNSRLSLLRGRNTQTGLSAAKDRLGVLLCRALEKKPKRTETFQETALSKLYIFHTEIYSTFVLLYLTAFSLYALVHILSDYMVFANLFQTVP